MKCLLLGENIKKPKSSKTGHPDGYPCLFLLRRNLYHSVFSGISYSEQAPFQALPFHLSSDISAIWNDVLKFHPEVSFSLRQVL